MRVRNRLFFLVKISLTVDAVRLSFLPNKQVFKKGMKTFIKIDSPLPGFFPISQHLAE